MNLLTQESSKYPQLVEAVLLLNEQLMKERDSLVTQKSETIKELNERKEEFIHLKNEYKDLKKMFIETKLSLQILEQNEVTPHKDLTERIRELFEERNDFSCVICLEMDRNILFLPCQHLCVCSECSTKLTKCPRCENVISEKLVAQIREPM